MKFNRLKKTALLLTGVVLVLLSACKITVYVPEDGGTRTTPGYTPTTVTAAPATTARTTTEATKPLTEPPVATTEERDESVLLAEALIPQFEKRYFLNRLSPQELTLFCTIYEAAANFQESVRFSEAISLDQLTEMMLLLNYECPELMQISGNYTYYTDAADQCVSVTFDYIMDESTYRAACAEIEALFSRWQRALSGRSDYEKEKFVYEYIIETCRYDEYTTHAGSCYGALVEGVARCEGYAKSFMWAMWALDIPCMTVTGEAANGDQFLYSRHSWNIVQIDGTYCYLDTTYDDVEQGGEQFPISYGFFNVDQHSIEQSRETDALYLRLGVPECASMEKSFHVKNGSYLRAGEQAAELLAENLYRAVESGQNRAYLKTETDTQFYDLLDTIDTEVQDWLNENIGRACEYSWYSYGEARAVVIDLFF